MENMDQIGWREWRGTVKGARDAVNRNGVMTAMLNDQLYRRPCESV